MEFGILLRLVHVMNLILILCCPFNIQGRETYLYDLVKKKKNATLTLACIQTFYQSIFIKLGLMIVTSTLYILISPPVASTLLPPPLPLLPLPPQHSLPSPLPPSTPSKPLPSDDSHLERLDPRGCPPLGSKSHPSINQSC